MGHIIWNRIISGKTLQSSKATKQLIKEKEVYIIASDHEDSPTVKVRKVKITKSPVSGSAYQCGLSARGFDMTSVDGGQYSDWFSPGQCFPLKFWYIWDDHKSEFLKYCGDYLEENNEPIDGFLESVYGTIDHPLNDWKIGFGSVWYTTDEKEAQTVKSLIMKYVKRCKD